MKEESIVLLSGGLDSTVLLWYAKKYSEVKVIQYTDYGHLSHKLDLKAANNVSHIFNKKHEADCLLNKIEMNTRSVLYGDSVDARSGIPTTFMPGRNLLLLTMAAATAYASKIKQIYIGVSEIDSNYPDCTEDFIKGAEVVLNLALGIDLEEEKIRIMAPFLFFNKKKIIKLGVKLGAPIFETRSCYRAGLLPCLKCAACKNRMDAFKELGIRDESISIERWEAYDG